MMTTTMTIKEIFLRLKQLIPPAEHHRLDGLKGYIQRQDQVGRWTNFFTVLRPYTNHYDEHRKVGDVVPSQITWDTQRDAEQAARMTQEIDELRFGGHIKGYLGAYADGNQPIIVPDNQTQRARGFA